MSAPAQAFSSTKGNPQNTPFLAIAWGLLLYTFVSTFPGSYARIDSGLDASWMYGLCDLAGSGYVFGRDVTFTYGPLGFLFNPLAVGACLAAGVVFWTILHVLLFGTMAVNLRSDPGKLTIFSAGYLLLIGLGLWREYCVLAVVIALAVLSLDSGPYQAVLTVLTAVLTVFAIEMKWSTGIAALAVTAGSWLLLFRAGPVPDRRSAIAAMWIFGISAITSVLALHQSPWSFWLWLRSSSEISGGYSSAMSLEGPVGVLILAAASAVVLAGLCLLVSPPVRLRFALCAVPAFFAFKHGFVRQGGHSMAFFSAVCMIPLLLAAVPSTSARDTKRLVAGFLALYGIAVIFATNYPAYPALTWSGYERLLSLQTGITNLKAVVDFQQLRRSLESPSNSLSTDVLPAEWLTRIRGAKVSVLPWELSIGAANHLALQPIPTLQLYSAYTSYLDRITADSFQQRGADYLVVSHQGLDGRNPFLDTPATWRAIMSHYELVDSDLLGRRALLVRKASPAEQLQRVANGYARLEEWVQVPATKKLLYGSIHLGYSLVGKLARTVYHVPEVHIELQRRSGRAESYRLLTETAIDGVLLNYTPANQQELEDVLRGWPVDPVVRFRIVAPRGYFSSGFGWFLEESSRRVEEQRIDPKPPELPSLTAVQHGEREASIDVTVSDPNGARDLQFIQVVVNRSLNGVSACYLSYEVPESRLWLIADAGAGPAGVGTLGAATILSNKQCQIAMNQVSATFGGNRLSLHIPVVFAAGFSGPMQVYGDAIDRGGLHPGFQPRAQLVLK